MVYFTSHVFDSHILFWKALRFFVGIFSKIFGRPT